LVYMFNSAAQKLFGFANPSDKGIRLKELPLDNNTRLAMLRRHTFVLQSGKASHIRNCRFITNRFDGTTDIHFTPLGGGATGSGTIVIFHVVEQSKAFPRKGPTGPQGGSRNGGGKNGKRPSTKKKSSRSKGE